MQTVRLMSKKSIKKNGNVYHCRLGTWLAWHRFSNDLLLLLAAGITYLHNKVTPILEFQLDEILKH